MEPGLEPEKTKKTQEEDPKETKENAEEPDDKSKTATELHRTTEKQVKLEGAEENQPDQLQSFKKRWRDHRKEASGTERGRKSREEWRNQRNQKKKRRNQRNKGNRKNWRKAT